MKSKINLLIRFFFIINLASFLATGCKKDNAPVTVTDIVGNVYQTVTIGSQVWMAENLKTTEFYDGSPIANLTRSNDWVSSDNPAYCWYDNDEANNKPLYGALYNYQAVKYGKLCPTGWHIPDDSEWTTLINYLGGDSLSAIKLKSTSTLPWALHATNESGFSALAGGYRWDSFYNLTYGGFWWSSSSTSTVNSHLQLLYRSTMVAYNYGYGFSVRCIKD